MIAAAYLRVSGKRQATDRWSLPAQREAITAYCAAQGWAGPTWYVEAHTAKDDDPDARPVFRQILVDAHARQFDTLLIVDVDRFARSVVAGLDAAARLERAGVRVVSLNDGDIDTGDPDSEFSFTLKLMLARRENRVRGRRSQAGRAAALAAGMHVALPPFGARIGQDGRLELDPATAPTLARILREAATGTAESIAARLTDEGVPTPARRRTATRWGPPGAFWWPSAIRDMVRRGAWLAAFDAPWPDLWRAARDRPVVARTRRGATTHLLTGLARCACGGRLFYGRGRGDRLCFGCRNPARGGTGYGCPLRRGYADHYEALIVAAILGLPDPVEERLIAKEVDPSAWESVAEDRKRLDDRYRLRLIEYPQLVAELAEIERREAALPRGDVLTVRLRAEVAPVVGRFATMEPGDQNAILRALAEAVIIDRRDLRIVWRMEARRIFGLNEVTFLAA